MKIYPLLLFAALHVAAGLRAQTLTRTITGSGGAPVVNARVTLFNADTSTSIVRYY